jgi:hypothetical protein
MWKSLIKQVIQLLIYDCVDGIRIPKDFRDFQGNLLFYKQELQDVKLYVIPSKAVRCQTHWFYRLERMEENYNFE